ncbi:RNA methyltransferase, TrmH family [Candidatus Kryptonium thompsonii]|uniref:RNA methyltransferase, TrmH family n=1 Tax=Candidatus Kryptonium thompsonii TaxID=1633631 RepID=A0A0P1MT71_9BACT|nr:RNA methyltransferase [Candidatus Kryptonium thompsoni]CUS80647.1 RNA methyltransferase, TrmH family [Candidatus Kryptonium thompsoni]CUS82492.1 RNA methyltransferase, TrmH family [Candidatus Kryptonium thompsoni]CUS88274.1 RNA methyltransferase, TrmH family [Candidatus Kryptonium thompsoni]CUS94931.1 RNA methyltransferase, TrmH family [Candidatus Kryptonium thompsoni]CUS98972.1 RNA methyltransferase, TrmH family [Candidatus Kryptonium thompsoni]
MKISKRKYSQLQLLKNKKYRYKTGLFILEGERLIADAIKFGAEVSFVAYSERFLKDQQSQEFLNYLKNKKIEIYEIGEDELEKVSEVETSQGIIAVAKMFEYSWDDVVKNVKQKEHATVVALDEISDPGNLGTIFRVCDWFKSDLILVSDMSVDVFNPKTLRATMGSVFNVPFLQNIDLKNYLVELKKLGFKIFSTAPSGKIDFRELEDEDKVVFVFGNEARGVKSEFLKISDAVVKIRKFGKAESLNVAVSAGIILSERAYSIFGR